MHAATLDVVDTLIDVNARAIELRRVDMYHQRLAGDRGDAQARGVGEPIVRVNHIELKIACGRDAEPRKALDLLHQVAGIILTRRCGNRRGALSLL